MKIGLVAAMEDEMDALLSQIDCEQFLSFDTVNFDLDPLNEYSNSTHPTPLLEPSNQPHLYPANNSRFKTDSDVEEAKKKAVPKNTDKNTSWAVNIWKQWSAHRRETCTSYSDWPTHLMIAHPTDMNYWLSKFVLETRKTMVTTTHPILCIAFAVAYWDLSETRLEINIFKDPVFAGFQRTLDSEMKRLRSLRLGVKRKQAEPITTDEENQLW